MFEQSTLQEQIFKNSGIMGKRVVDYIQDVSSLLSQITAYREKHQITFVSLQ